MVNSYLRMLLVFGSLLISLSLFQGVSQAQNTVVIGVNIPLSGERAAEGETSRMALELARKTVNDSGGLQIGQEKYNVEYVYRDNKSEPNGAISAAIELISKDKVLGIIGPIASSTAIPASGICQSFKTPMITPTSTNPKTTANKPYIFRAIALDTFQADVLVDFSISEFDAKQAAVLYKSSSSYPRGMAEFFKSSFENRVGEGSVVAYEDFLGSEKDLSNQLEVIVASDADILFLPQYAYEIPELIEQIRDKGWNKTILGGDAWESAELTSKCGELCHGLFYGSHFIAKGAKGKAGAFVKAYTKMADEEPNFYAALGYDSANLLFTAISQLQTYDSDLLATRKNIKNNIARIKGFQGVAGMMDMNENGDPTKSAVVIKIDADGLSAYKVVTP